MLTVIIYLCACIGATCSIDFSCIDESGNNVDWYYLYKLPDIGDSSNKLVQDGEGYAYMTSKNYKGWVMSKTSIDDKSSIPGQTLAPLYEKAKKDILYILYNDQDPKKTHGQGHTKGVVVAGDDGGFWLIHSTPKFAPIPSGNSKYSFSKNGLRNGQSFLCITLKPKELETAGSQIMYNDITVYANSVPKDLKSKYPTLADVADGVKVKSSSLNSVKNIESAGGTTFRVFSKRGKYGKELYTDFVAPDLKVDLVVQTWPNSRSHQKSSCSRKNYNVENVEETKISGISFTTSKDHSKWAASTSKSKPWICIGDINKDNAQEKRGGGTVCQKNKDVWQAYYDSVVDLDSCSGKKKSDKIGKSPTEDLGGYWTDQFWKDVTRYPRNRGVSGMFGLIGPIG